MEDSGGVYVRFANGVQVFDLNGRFADGSLASVRTKFADVLREGMVAQLVEEVLNGTKSVEQVATGRFYLGDWTKGEIEITGIIRIVVNRYWTEIDYSVLFPPRPGKTEPAAGSYRNIIWNAGVEAGAAAFLITESGEIIVLTCFRHAVRRWCLEIPRGVRKPGESNGDCAKREANEECGATLTEQSQVIELGSLEPDTGVMRNRVPVVLITNVQVDPAKVRRDVSESELRAIRLTKAKFMAKVRSGELKDALLLAAYTQALAHGVFKKSRRNK